MPDLNPYLPTRERALLVGDYALQVGPDDDLARELLYVEFLLFVCREGEGIEVIYAALPR